MKNGLPAIQTILFVYVVKTIVALAEFRVTKLVNSVARAVLLHAIVFHTVTPWEIF